uniref:Adapter molecule Crk n=1 Tax=Aceria tosichella TaxID=561515 RepID=A0A6G1SNS4_9ACAR
MLPVSSFDPYDEDSWFFGYMSRKDAAALLSDDNNDIGAFLIRESTTAKGDLVLSVKETDDKISHYIINRIPPFDSKNPQPSSQVRFKIGDHVFSDIPALLAFYKSNNLDDTPLKFPAVCKVPNVNKRSFTRDYLAEIHSDVQSEHTSTLHRKLPSKAQVIQSRIPNAYDKTALTLKEGQILKVTKVDISGCWEGEIEGRVGHFPFNYVRFIEE